MIRIALRLAVIALVSAFASAVSAVNQGSMYLQPDGLPVFICLHGDALYSWTTDDEGYTVLRDAFGWWQYAKSEDGELRETGIRVGQGLPYKYGLTKNLKVAPSKRPINELQQRRGPSRERRELLNTPTTALCSYQATASNPCKRKNLIVLVKFADHSSRVLPQPEEYEDLFNANNTLQSVSQVFKHNSYGSFILDTHVTPWIQSSRTEAFAVSTSMGRNLAATRLTWREAMQVLEASGLVDFSQFDADGDGCFDSLGMVHSGKEIY